MSTDDCQALPHTIIESKIFELLATRKNGATICPSEVARSLAFEPALWRMLMPQIRHVAQSLVRDGRLRVTRGGVLVMPKAQADLSA